MNTLCVLQFIKSIKGPEKPLLEVLHKLSMSTEWIMYKIISLCHIAVFLYCSNVRLLFLCYIYKIFEMNAIYLACEQKSAQTGSASGVVSCSLCHLDSSPQPCLSDILTTHTMS